MVQAKDPPSHYLNKLRTYLDPKASRSHRVSLPYAFFISQLVEGNLEAGFKKQTFFFYLKKIKD